MASYQEFDQYADEINAAVKDKPVARQAKAAAEFKEAPVEWLWQNYIPLDDFTALFAPGGAGKTFFTCLLAADVSTGRVLPGDRFSIGARNVLIISAEDSGAKFRSRLKQCNADLKRIFILDRTDSEGMSFFGPGEAEFIETVKAYNPALVVLDPYFAFVGSSIDLNKLNQVRPMFRRAAAIARECHCAMVLVNHVNKGTHDNANNNALGSGDFINAARSAFQIVNDTTDKNERVLIHTKSNDSCLMQSVKFRIDGRSVSWAGYSTITKDTLEEAARNRKSIAHELSRQAVSDSLINALVQDADANNGALVSTYSEFKNRHGDNVFGGGDKCKPVLEGVAGELLKHGYVINFPKSVRGENGTGKGFRLARMADIDAEMRE